MKRVLGILIIHSKTIETYQTILKILQLGHIVCITKGRGWDASDIFLCYDNINGFIGCLAEHKADKILGEGLIVQCSLCHVGGPAIGFATALRQQHSAH